MGVKYAEGCRYLGNVGRVRPKGLPAPRVSACLPCPCVWAVRVGAASTQGRGLTREIWGRAQRGAQRPPVTRTRGFSCGSRGLCDPGRDGTGLREASCFVVPRVRQEWGAGAIRSPRLVRRFARRGSGLGRALESRALSGTQALVPDDVPDCPAGPLQGMTAAPIRKRG